MFFPARTRSCHCHGWPRLLLLTGVLYLQIWQHSKNTYTTFIQTYNHTHTPSHSQDQPITFHIKGHHVSPSSKFSELRLPHCTQDKVQRPQHYPCMELLSPLLQHWASSPADSSSQSTHGSLSSSTSPSLPFTSASVSAALSLSPGALVHLHLPRAAAPPSHIP